MEKEHALRPSNSQNAVKKIKQILKECQIENADIFDHAPVLRIQVPEEVFAHALQVRERLLERIKPLGYRFVALDLDEL